MLYYPYRRLCNVKNDEVYSKKLFSLDCRVLKLKSNSNVNILKYYLRLFFFRQNLNIYFKAKKNDIFPIQIYDNTIINIILIPMFCLKHKIIIIKYPELELLYSYRFYILPVDKIFIKIILIKYLLKIIIIRRIIKLIAVIAFSTSLYSN